MFKMMTINENRKIEIEKNVEQFCGDCIFSGNGPIDVVAIARKKGFVVQRLNMDKDTTGMLLYSASNNISGLDTNKLIVIKKGLPEEQSRLILAHELGHYSLLSEKNPFIAHRTYSHLKKSTIEQDADYFARALLMPKERVNRLINNLKAHNCDDNEIIQEIAKNFNVTETKAKTRFYELEQGTIGNEMDNKN